MKKIENFDRIDEYVDKLRECRMHTKQSSVSVSPQLRDIMIIANTVYIYLRGLGNDKIKRAKLALNEPKEYIDESVLSTGVSFFDPLQKTMDITDMKYAIRTIKTYQTLMNWQIKLEEFRKLKSLDSIL